MTSRQTLFHFLVPLVLLFPSSPVEAQELGGDSLRAIAQRNSRSQSDTSADSPSEQPRFEGTAKWSRRSRLAFGIGGKIARISVEEGDRVKAGDCLVLLHDETARAEWVEAKVRASADGQLKAVTAELRSSTIRLENMRKSNLRVQDSYSNAMIQQQSIEVERLRAEVDGQRQILDVAQASVKVLAARLGDSQLKAPYAGVVVRRLKSAGEAVTLSEPVLELVDDSRLRIEFTIPQRLWSNIRAGDPIEIFSAVSMKASEPGRPRVQAEVQFVDRSVQPVRNVVRAWAEIETPEWLSDGMGVQIVHLAALR